MHRLPCARRPRPERGHEEHAEYADVLPMPRREASTQHLRHLSRDVGRAPCHHLLAGMGCRSQAGGEEQPHRLQPLPPAELLRELPPHGEAASAGFLARHADESKKNAASCSTCHQQSFCDNCHSIKRAHPPTGSAPTRQRCVPMMPRANRATSSRSATIATSATALIPPVGCNGTPPRPRRSEPTAPPATPSSSARAATTTRCRPRTRRVDARARQSGS